MGVVLVEVVTVGGGSGPGEGRSVRGGAGPGGGVPRPGGGGPGGDQHLALFFPFPTLFSIF